MVTVNDNVPYSLGSGDIYEQLTEVPGAVSTLAPETPIIPSVVDPPGTNNVFVRPRTGVAPPDTQDTPEEPAPPVHDVSPDSGSARSDNSQPAREQPVGSSAEPSLHKALFTYALPVVCAWFGTIVTDLF